MTQRLNTPSFIQNALKIFYLFIANACFMTAAHAFPMTLTPQEDSFTSEVHCEWSCKEKPKAKHVSNREEYFSPRLQGLTRGNGGLWGLLGVRLWQWGERHCVERATKECKSLAQIESVKLLKLHSKAANASQDKAWELSENPQCQERSKTLVSPYDPSRSLNFNTPNLPLGKSTSLNYDVFDTPQASTTSLKNCKGPLIRAKICYGDCIIMDGKNVDCPAGTYSLCSKNQGVQDSLYICGDKFLSHNANDSQLSRELQEMRCRSFFWTSVQNDSSTKSLAACAAMRADVDCKEVIDVLRNPASARKSASPSLLEEVSGTSCPHCK